MVSSSLFSTILTWAYVLMPSGASSSSSLQPRACIASTPLVTDIYTFPLGTWVENIYRRRDQQYLVSLLTPKPDFYLIDVTARTASLVATLPGVRSMLGIAPGSRADTYVVIGENYSPATFTGEKGSCGLYTIDMSKYDAAGSKGVKVELSLKVPNATSLDGLAAVNPSRGIYLASDLGGGAIYRLDIASGKSTIIISNKYTARLPGTVGGPDGLKIRDGYVYWSSNGAGVFARAPINVTGYPTGPTEKLADVGISDDFIFNSRGDAYLTTGDRNTVSILKAGESELRTLPGRVYAATAARFGADQSSLILSTAGNYSQCGSKITRPGKVVKLDLPCQN